MTEGDQGTTGRVLLAGPAMLGPRSGQFRQGAYTNASLLRGWGPGKGDPIRPLDSPGWVGVCFLRDPAGESAGQLLDQGVIHQMECLRRHGRMGSLDTVRGHLREIEA